MNIAREREDLEEDLDEDSGGGGGVLLGEADVGEDVPGEGVGAEEVGEELGDVPQLVRLQAVDHRVLLHEALLKVLLVHLVDHAEPLPQQPVVPQVRPLLAAALQQHYAQLHLRHRRRRHRRQPHISRPTTAEEEEEEEGLQGIISQPADFAHLLAGFELDLEQLVPGLLEIDAGHDGEVDRPPQVHEVRLGLVLDLHHLLVLLLGLIPLLLGAACVGPFLLRSRALVVPEDALLQLLVGPLVLHKARVPLEDI